MTAKNLDLTSDDGEHDFKMVLKLEAEPEYSSEVCLFASNPRDFPFICGLRMKDNRIWGVARGRRYGMGLFLDKHMASEDS